MSKCHAFFLLMLFLIFSAIPAKGNERVLDLSSNTIVRLSDVFEEIKAANFIFIGEVHDNKAHHVNQLRLIRQLYESGVNIAIGLEMFDVYHQTLIDEWVKGSLNIEDFKSAFHSGWKIPWHFYEEIFLFARDHKIPLVAINISRDITNQVFKQGIGSLSSEQLKQLSEIDTSFDSDYTAYIRKVFGMHKMDETRFKNFCIAQMVWDSAMSQNLIRYLNKNPAKTVVVLAGGGHSWKPGIPLQLKKSSKYKSKVIIHPTSIITRKSATRSDADYLWLEKWKSEVAKEPDNQPYVKQTVLFDQGHKQQFLIEGNNPLDLTELSILFQDQGFQVKIGKDEITDEILHGVHVLLISGPFKPFSPSEVQTIARYLRKGGRMSVMLHIASPVVPLLKEIGVVTSNGVVYENENLIHGKQSNFHIKKLVKHGLTEGLDKYSTFGSWALNNITLDTDIIASTGENAWVDLDKDRIQGTKDAVQSFGVIIAGKFGNGRFVVFGDDAIFQNQFLKNENQILGRNLVRWLNGRQ